MQYLKEDVREKILSSALIEFRNNGYTDASMRDIAARAGIALGSTYRYFKSKEALFNTLIGPIYDRIISYLTKIQTQLDNYTTENCIEIIGYIKDLLNKIIEFVKESSNELSILFNKSKDSTYENFKTELTTLINSIFIGAVNEDIKDDECTRILVYTVSHDFIEGLSFILNQNYDGNKVKILVNKLVYFYISDMDKRFNHLDN